MSKIGHFMSKTSAVYKNMIYYKHVKLYYKKSIFQYGISEFLEEMMR